LLLKLHNLLDHLRWMVFVRMEPKN
jgi:hypothetical protein